MDSPIRMLVEPPHLDSQAARAVRYGGLKKKEQLGDGSKGLVGSNGEIMGKYYPRVMTDIAMERSTIFNR